MRLFAVVVYAKFQSACSEPVSRITNRRKCGSIYTLKVTFASKMMMTREWNKNTKLWYYEPKAVRKTNYARQQRPQHSKKMSPIWILYIAMSTTTTTMKIQAKNRTNQNIKSKNISVVTSERERSRKKKYFIYLISTFRACVRAISFSRCGQFFATIRMAMGNRSVMLCDYILFHLFIFKPFKPKKKN